MNYKGILSILRFASDIIGKLPAKEDSLFTTILKVLAIGDSAHARWMGGSSSKIPSAFAHYDLVEATNEPFVRLFFGTSLKQQFKITRWPLEQNRELLVARGPMDERFLFQETQWGEKAYISSTFFHSSNVDFPAVMASLWLAYEHGMYLSTEGGEGVYSSHEITYQAVHAPRNEILTRKSRERFQEVLSACRADIDAGIHRCYIAAGPPGTGKSSFVLHLAEALGGRLLKIDASSIPRIGVKELSFVLTALRPRVLLIDDFDRAPADAVGARLLFLLEHLKAAHAETMVVITVNDPAALDPAMLRSERIDEPIDFTLPDDEERRELIEKLLPQHTHNLPRLVSETDGLNHADITDLCKRLCKEPIDKVLKMKKRLRAMAEAAAQKTNQPPAISNNLSVSKAVS
jgi:hypothetical protein